MYLKTDSITFDGKTGFGNIFEHIHPLPCVLIFQGLKAASDLAYNFLSSQADQNQRNP